MKRKKLDAFQIKLFMAALMVLDHLKIIPGLVPPQAEGVIHLITRCVGVWFAYLAVEGFLHSGNRLRYDGRLFLWAIFMELGNLVLNLSFRRAGVAVYNNIFLTLAFGVLVLILLFHGREGSGGGEKTAVKAVRLLAAAAAAAAGIFFGEGGMVLIPFMLITYLFRNRVGLRNLCYGLFAYLLFAMSFQWYPGDFRITVQMLFINSDWAFPLVIPFLSVYSGERGRNGRFAKYFFYVFYPAHIWILAAIAYFTVR